MRFRAAAAADAMRTTTSVDFDDDGEKVLTVAQVTKILRTESKSHPTFYPSRRIRNDEMRYSSDVFQFSGEREAFAKTQSRFERRFFADLKTMRSEIENVSIDLNVFLVRWNATFVPAKLVWLQNVALNWPFGDVDIERKDILHKMGETTKFTYALFRTMKRLATEKKLTIPGGKDRGQTKMTFDEEANCRPWRRICLW